MSNEKLSIFKGRKGRHEVVDDAANDASGVVVANERPIVRVKKESTSVEKKSASVEPAPDVVVDESGSVKPESLVRRRG